MTNKVIHTPPYRPPIGTNRHPDAKVTYPPSQRARQACETTVTKESHPLSHRVTSCLYKCTHTFNDRYPCTYQQRYTHTCSIVGKSTDIQDTLFLSLYHPRENPMHVSSSYLSLSSSLTLKRSLLVTFVTLPRKILHASLAVHPATTATASRSESSLLSVLSDRRLSSPCPQSPPAAEQL